MNKYRDVFIGRTVALCRDLIEGVLILLIPVFFHYIDDNRNYYIYTNAYFLG